VGVGEESGTIALGSGKGDGLFGWKEESEKGKRPTLNAQTFGITYWRGRPPRERKKRNLGQQTKYKEMWGAIWPVSSQRVGGVGGVAVLGRGSSEGILKEVFIGGLPITDTQMGGQQQEDWKGGPQRKGSQFVTAGGWSKQWDSEAAFSQDW